MRNKIVIFMVLLINLSGSSTNRYNPIEILDCYIHIIKLAIEKQKWNIDITPKDSLCANKLSAYDLLIDKDTLWIIPIDYSKNKYRLKTFLVSDSVAIVQFQMDTVFINERNLPKTNTKRKNSYIEFSVILDNSKETGVRVNFGRPILLEESKKGEKSINK